MSKTTYLKYLKKIHEIHQIAGINGYLNLVQAHLELSPASCLRFLSAEIIGTCVHYSNVTFPHTGIMRIAFDRNDFLFLQIKLCLLSLHTGSAQYEKESSARKGSATVTLLHKDKTEYEKIKFTIYFFDTQTNVTHTILVHPLCLFATVSNTMLSNWVTSPTQGQASPL